ncbi:hypothetical protein GOP47_0018516 [Adiantum capillus-veneris]|uniref:Uncharacterized protein n=1 Tax=Adiantum capillus-veneris TaxID=13818 RepID=A0A9D4UDX7_ADICA|nr:hypothetical protein GOP47_0018516 [Adiantum capillus-veneris]
MAGASPDKIDALIAREYTFVQELVWLPPRRNPFPRCTDKIVSDLRKLEVLYRRPATGGRNNLRSSRRAADHALSVLIADYDELIRFRRSLCQKLPAVQTSSSLKDFEHRAEALIMQHLDSAWGSGKHGSVETWASKVKGLDFQALDLALQHLLAPFFGYAVEHKEHQYDCCYNSVSVEKRQRHQSKEDENASDATSLCDSKEVEDDAVSEVDSIEGSSAGQNQELPLMLISNSEVKHERQPYVPNINSSRGNRPIQVEMTMKARICDEHITAPEQHCWHIIFGIVNHDRCEVAVHSLTYWSFDNESEVSTIKWPKGGVILKEAPSLLCYSCQMRCAGPSDSPRVAFSWQYRRISKHLVAVRGGMDQELKERVIEGCPLELQTRRLVGMETPMDSLCMVDSSDTADGQFAVAGPSQTVYQRAGDPFYKRIGNLFSRKDSCKKARTSTE